MKYHISYEKLRKQLIVLHYFILVGQNVIQNKTSGYSPFFITDIKNNNHWIDPENQNAKFQSPNVTLHNETTNYLEIHQNLYIIDKEEMKRIIRNECWWKYYHRIYKNFINNNKQWIINGGKIINNKINKKL